MDSLSFARTSQLYWLVLVLVLGALAIDAGRRRRAIVAAFGRTETVAGLSSLRPPRRRQARISLFAAIALLAVAAAGPRWGKGGEGGVVVGRDLIVVIDLSNSMSAADMADADNHQRWQAARAGVHDLLTAIGQRGGHRVGLVAFAVKPWVVCPLTSDYDHVRARLEEFSPSSPPPETRPDPDEAFASGTAIGAALRMAVAAHDPRFPGYQDILLVSDGDGPGVESEAEGGARVAELAQIPVYTVGVGDPIHPTDLIFGGGEEVEFVGTKLQEGVLKDIARRTRGEYYPARRDVPKLGEWFAQAIESRPSRELADDVIPQPQDRSVWFLGAAFVLLVGAWVWEP